jgi:cytoskeleton protein RodZ
LAVQKQQGSDSSQTTASLDVVPTANPVAPEPAPMASPASAQPLPYLASLAPVVRASENVLTLRMRADSWVQVQAPDGSRVEQGIVNAGELRSYKAGEVGKVVLGNAAAVEVQQAGSTVDMTTYQRANVVRFTVSSDGSLAPVID